MIKIKGHPQLRRDPSTGAIININVQSLQREKTLEKRVESLEISVNKIMEYLKIKDNMDGEYL